MKTSDSSANSLPRPPCLAHAHALLRPTDEKHELFSHIADLSRHFGLRAERVEILLQSLPPGTRISPPLARSHRDEIYYFLSGKGTVWLDGETFNITPHDCVGFPAGKSPSHTFINNGENTDDLVFLVFRDNGIDESLHYPLDDAGNHSNDSIGSREDPSTRSLGKHDGWPSNPRSDAVPHPGDATESSPAQPKAAARGPNPPVHSLQFHSSILFAPVLAFPMTPDTGADYNDIAPLSTISGLSGRFRVQYKVVPPGTRSNPPHAHSRDDRLTYVIRGNGKLWLDGDIYDVGAGDCVGFPAGTGVSHAFINDEVREEDELLLITFEECFEDNRVSYPLAADVDKCKTKCIEDRTWWVDAPTRQLGPHDGMPLQPRLH